MCKLLFFKLRFPFEEESKKKDNSKEKISPTDTDQVHAPSIRLLTLSGLTFIFVKFRTWSNLKLHNLKVHHFDAFLIREEEMESGSIGVRVRFQIPFSDTRTFSYLIQLPHVHVSIFEFDSRSNQRNPWPWLFLPFFLSFSHSPFLPFFLPLLLSLPV